MEKILIDEKICVRCGACVSECEFGGVTFRDGKILVDDKKPEDWTTIISICPTGAFSSLNVCGGIKNE